MQQMKLLSSGWQSAPRRWLPLLVALGALVGLSGARLSCEAQAVPPPVRGLVTSSLSQRGVVVRTASSTAQLASADAPKVELPRCRSKTPLSVLFIGNSYTFYNDMPRLVTQIAGSAGCNLEVSWATNGGYQLSLHAQDPTTIDAIRSRPWDAVVLQNQSQEPAFLRDEVSERSLPAVKALANEIYAAHPQTQILFFSTWGRRSGDRANCKYNPRVCSFDGHTEAVEDGYRLYAETVGGELVQVGRAFQFVSRDQAAPVDFTDLYDRDGSHPSPFGSYLAAATFFYELTGVSPEGQAFPETLFPEEAAYLQQIAAMTVEGAPLEEPGGSVVTEEALVARCTTAACSKPTTDHMEGAATRVVLFEGTCSDWYIRSDVTLVASVMASLECQNGSCATRSIDTWSTRTGAPIPPGTYSVFVTIDADASGNQTPSDFEACEDSAFSVSPSGDGRVVTIDRFYPASLFT